MTSVTIIIPTYRDSDALARTLAATDWSGAELVVVSTAEDPSVVPVRDAYPAVAWIQAPSGRARQMNAGAAAARADWLLFLHADTHLPAAWRALCFPIEWRGRQVRFALRQAPLTLTTALDHGRSLHIEVGDLRHELHAGRAWTCRWSQDELSWQEVNP